MLLANIRSKFIFGSVCTGGSSIHAPNTGVIRKAALAQDVKGKQKTEVLTAKTWRFIRTLRLKLSILNGAKENRNFISITLGSFFFNSFLNQKIKLNFVWTCRILSNVFPLLPESELML